ncbi:MAG: hypothetical protein MAG795_00863 [Candidatus Woesearchaeota archaeon]|nr:hypothetical protein [Candidatus Woesearchaeota archaeon]
MFEDFMDKVMFWKKKDDFALPEPSGSSMPNQDLGLDQDMGLGMPGDQNLSQQGLGQQRNQNLGLGQQTSQASVQQANPMKAHSQFQTSMPRSSPAPQQQPQYNQRNTDTYTISKEIEVISSKLDALRAEIENINQKLSNLERYMGNRRVETNRMPPRTY